MQVLKVTSTTWLLSHVKPFEARTLLEAFNTTYASGILKDIKDSGKISMTKMLSNWLLIKLKLLTVAIEWFESA
jgi:hypothetical protein